MNRTSMFGFSLSDRRSRREERDRAPEEALPPAAARPVTYRSDRGPRAGVVRGEPVGDAWDALGGGAESVRELLAQERLGDLTELGEWHGRPLSETELLPPVPDPEKIICVGLNYR